MALAVALLSLVSGCCKSLDAVAKRENGEAAKWITKSWTGQYDWASTNKWKPVKGSMISKADGVLQSKAIVQLTAADATEFVDLVSTPEDGIPWLLRGVGAGYRNFPLEIALRPDGSVWVGGAVNNKCSIPMRREPVVVWLQKTPTQLYVTFYVNRD